MRRMPVRYNFTGTKGNWRWLQHVPLQPFNVCVSRVVPCVLDEHGFP